MTSVDSIHYGPLPRTVELTVELPAGGMGRVWKARGPSGEWLVLKRLPAGLISADQLLRFGREIRLLAKLECAGVPRVRAFHDDPADPYFLMDFVDGVALSEWRPPAARPAARAVAELAVGCLDILEGVHGAGILHRDLSPRNILVDQQGRPWIIDFGIAVADDDTGLTLTGDILGTLRYASPEQAAGAGREDLTPASDLYSLGLVMLEKLSGRPVRNGKTQQEVVLQAVRRQPVLSRDFVPELEHPLARIFDALVAREVRDRYATAGAAARDLRRYLAGQAAQPPRPPLPRRARQRWSTWPPGRRRAIQSAAAALFLGCGFGVYWEATWKERQLQRAAELPPQQSASFLQQLATLRPADRDFEEAWFARVGEVCHLLLDHAQAERFVSDALEFRDLPPLRLHRAWRRVQLRRLDEALADLEAGAAAAPAGGQPLEGVPLACAALSTWLDYARRDTPAGTHGTWDIDADRETVLRTSLARLDQAGSMPGPGQEDIFLWRSCAFLPFGYPRNFMLYAEAALRSRPRSALLRAYLAQRSLMHFAVMEARKTLEEARRAFPELEGHWSLIEASAAHEDGDLEEMGRAARKAAALLDGDPHSGRRARVCLWLARCHAGASPAELGAELDALLDDQAGLAPHDILLLAEGAALLGRAADPRLEALCARELNRVDFEWQAWQHRQRLARWRPPNPALDPYAGSLPDWYSTLTVAGDPPPTAVLDAGQFPSLQAAIDAAPDGARIVIPPGTWRGAVQIFFKRLTLLGGGETPAETVLDLLPEQQASVLTVWQSPRLVAANLTIIQGWGGHLQEDGGGAMTVAYDEDDSRGGGVHVSASSARLERCVLAGRDERGAAFGGGIAVLDGARVLLHDCEVRNNRVDKSGGGVMVAAEAEAVLESCRVTGNVCPQRGGRQAGIGLSERGRVWVLRSLLGDVKGFPIAPFLVFGEGPAACFISVQESVVQGGWYGCGNRLWQP